MHRLGNFIIRIAGDDKYAVVAMHEDLPPYKQIKQVFVSSDHFQCAEAFSFLKEGLFNYSFFISMINTSESFFGHKEPCKIVKIKHHKSSQRSILNIWTLKEKPILYDLKELFKGCM